MKKMLTALAAAMTLASVGGLGASAMADKGCFKACKEKRQACRAERQKMEKGSEARKAKKKECRKANRECKKACKAAKAG